MPFLGLHRFCLGFALLISSALNGRAGHDLFTQLVFSETSDTGLARTRTPTSVGIPLPPDTKLLSTTNLVLVGSTETQFTILSRWPNGSIRWLLLDAIIDIPKEAASVSLPLTTGQQAPHQGNLASEDASEIRLNTGAAVFVIPKLGKGFLSRIETADQQLISSQPFDIEIATREGYDRSPALRTITLEKNGPVTASVLIQEALSIEPDRLEIKTRVTAFRYQSYLKIEFLTLSSPQNRLAIDSPTVTVTAPLSMKSLAPFTESAQSRVHSVKSDEGRELLWISEKRLDGSFMTTTPSKTGIQTLTHRPKSLKPGSLERATIYLETSPTPNTAATIANPLIGRAASVETYNDGLAFHDKLLPTESEANRALLASARTSSDAANALPYIKAFLRAVNESYAQFYAPSKHQIETQWNAGISSRDYSSVGIGIWPMMTGDTTLRNQYLDWGANFLKRVEESDTDLEFDKTLLQLVDLRSHASIEPTPDILWNLIETGLDNWQAIQARSKEKPTPASLDLIVGLSLTLQQAFASPENEDQVYDWLESLLYQTPERLRGERWHYEAYLISGNPEIIRQGNDYLERSNSETAQNLRHLMASPLRYRIWRPLSLSVAKTSNSEALASWTVPPRAERYRFKTAPRSIASSLLETSTDSVPFHEATNLIDEPLPARRGSRQTFQLPHPPHQISGRYLERGGALPTPDQESRTETDELPPPSISPHDLSQQLLQIAGGFVMLVLIRMWWKRYQSKVTRLLLLAVASLGFAACSPSPSDSGATASPESNEATVSLSDGGSFRVRYSTEHKTIPLNVHFGISVSVEPINETKNSITIEVSADMPSHGHGINTAPSVQDLGNGTFQVDGILLHMKGKWELYVDIIDGPIRERASFPITL